MLVAGCHQETSSKSTHLGGKAKLVKGVCLVNCLNWVPSKEVRFQWLMWMVVMLKLWKAVRNKTRGIKDVNVVTKQ